MATTVPAPAAAAERRRRLAARGAEALGAVALLTVLPVPRAAHRSPSALTLTSFVGVGLLLGCLLAGVEAGLAHVLAVPARSALLLAVLAGVTGALHLDGLADTADGLFGGGTPQRRLEIMADARNGGFGVAAVAVTLAVQYGALLSLSGARLQGLVVTVGASRVAMAVALGVSAPARPEGLGRAFSVAGRGRAAAVAVAAVAAAAWPLGGVRALAAVGAAVAVAIGVAALFRVRVGGITGDGCGATGEVALAVALLCVGAT